MLITHYLSINVLSISYHLYNLVQVMLSPYRDSVLITLKQLGVQQGTPPLQPYLAKMVFYLQKLTSSKSKTSR
jgi:hypothetical protein